MSINAYYTKGGRIIYTTPEMADKFIQDGSYVVATPNQILFDNIRKGRVPDDYTKVHFPFWDNANPIFGYGTVAYNLIQFSVKNKIALQTGEYQGQKIALIYKTIAGKYNGDHTFSHLKNYYNQFSDANRPKIFIYTMWETTKLPEIQVEYLNKYADVVIVPSKWQIEIMKKCGVNKPCEIMAHGTDQEFEYFERSDKFETFTFLHYNAGEDRKGYKEVIQAFNNEFKKGENVKLILKTTNRSGDLWEYLNSNKDHIKNEIQVISKIGSKADLNELCQKSHCFVFPSKGEGFGLTPLEAIKTGLPSIITKGHAFEDFWNEACLEVGYKMESAVYGDEYFLDQSDMGLWFQPKIKDIQKQMRFVLENWSKVKEQGRKGSTAISKKFTWDLVTKDLHKIIHKYV